MARRGGTRLRRAASLTIRESVPALYGPLLPPFFSARVPREEAAACASCPMLPEPGGTASSASLFFDPQTKCCTYFPRIPNYLVGGLLADTSPEGEEGRRRVRERLRSRAGVTPWGLVPGRRHTLLYAAGAGLAFGRSRSLRCPYLDAAGACTVRPWWEATCHTWFCKHAAGEDGRRFWRALQRYLAAAEDALTAHVLERAALPPDAAPIGNPPTPLDADELDERPLSEAEYRRLWGRHAGREESFYIRAHDLARRLTRREFEALGGAVLALKLRALREAHTPAVAAKPPPVLQRAPALASTRLEDGRYRITIYSEYDPLVVSPAVFRLLDEFDGVRTNREVTAALRRAGRPVLPERSLLTLYQARVLVVPGS